MTENIDEKTWPAVDAAYEFVLPSYQLLTGRFEAADNRITALMTVASSLMLAAPVLARSVRPDVSFVSGWFAVALIVFGLVILCGLLARITGVLMLPNPRVIFETALTKQEWRFKADAIYFAGQHFDANATAINVKGNWSIVITVLVVVQVVLLMLWTVE